MERGAHQESRKLGIPQRNKSQAGHPSTRVFGGKRAISAEFQLRSHARIYFLWRRAPLPLSASEFFRRRLKLNPVHNLLASASTGMNSASRVLLILSLAMAQLELELRMYMAVSSTREHCSEIELHRPHISTNFLFLSTELELRLTKPDHGAASGFLNSSRPPRTFHFTSFRH